MDVQPRLDRGPLTIRSRRFRLLPVRSPHRCRGTRAQHDDVLGSVTRKDAARTVVKSAIQGDHRGREDSPDGRNPRLEALLELD